jgi:hypothetical protein
MMAVRPVEAAEESSVDQVVGAAREKLLALARVAQVTGDPSGPVLDSQIAMLTAQYRLFEETKLALSDVCQPAAVFTDRQVEDITQRLLGGCQAWTRIFIRTSYVRSWALLLAALLVTLGIGLGTGWRLHSPPSELACGDQADGSRVCWMYTKLPTPPVAKR